VEKVEGRDTYRLKLTMRAAKCGVFGSTRRPSWRSRGSPTYGRGDFFCDYKNVNGLMIPHVLETTVQGVKQSQKMTVESVVVNAKLDDTLFMAPNLKAK
jgi:hypothetical protein